MDAVTYHDHTVTFPALPQHAKFFETLTAGRWDKGLFEFLSRYVDDKTAYIDVGAWLGVSPFWAAHRAKQVIAVEPDPVCLKTLREMQVLNSAPVTIVGAALSNDSHLKLHAVGGFGSSMTSAIRPGGSGGEVDAKGITIAELVGMAGGDPICMKIDIEGYEYHLTDQLAAIPAQQTKAVLISLHPRFCAASLSGNFIVRRWATAVATVKLARALNGFRLANPHILARVLFSLALQPNIVHRDLIFVPARR